MTQIVDSKYNLSRGTTDLVTPSVFESELLFTYQERIETLSFRIDQFQAMPQTKSIKNEIESLEKVLKAARTKANKRIDYHMLLLDRLKADVPNDVFEKCCKLAKLDKKRLLGLIYEGD